MSDRGEKKAAAVGSTASDDPAGSALARAYSEATSSRLVKDVTAEPLRSPLVNVLEADVIPKLAAARGIRLDEQLRHWGTGPNHNSSIERRPTENRPDSKEFDAFVGMLLSDDLNGAWETVKRHLRQEDALGFMNCCQDLLEPAAQTLGKLWEDDEADFNQVTRSVGHLQALLRRMPSAPNPALTERVLPSSTDGSNPRIMLLPAPGEQHTLGVSMLGRAFHDAGWLIDGGPGLSAAETRKRLARTNYDVLGFSISCASWIEPTAVQIEELRSVSRNPDLQVLIGGPLLSLEPNLVTLIGADDSAANLHEALEVAAAMLDRSTASQPC